MKRARRRSGSPITGGGEGTAEDGDKSDDADYQPHQASSSQAAGAPTDKAELR